MPLNFGVKHYITQYIQNKEIVPGLHQLNIQEKTKIAQEKRARELVKVHRAITKVPFVEVEEKPCFS